MRAYFFLLFVCPVMLFAQNQQVPSANGATDCPTFGKKNTSSKAGFFQYMRTNKPPKPEQQTIYRTSALPTLKPAVEEEEAITLRKQKRAERAAARKQQQLQNDQEESVVAAVPKVIAEEPIETKALTDKPTDTKAMADKEASIENGASAKEDAAKRAEERDKKVRKAARKEKIQHFFKRTNKPSSRKNVQKCPQF